MLKLDEEIKKQIKKAAKVLQFLTKKFLCELQDQILDIADSLPVFG